MIFGFDLPGCSVVEGSQDLRRSIGIFRPHIAKQDMHCHTNSPCDSLPDLTSTNKDDYFFQVLVPLEFGIMVSSNRSFDPLRGSSRPACAHRFQVFADPLRLVLERHVRRVLYSVKCFFRI